MEDPKWRGRNLAEASFCANALSPPGNPAGRRRPSPDRARSPVSAALALVSPAQVGMSPETLLLGLPLARRTVLAAARAGFDAVLVVDATPGIRAALSGTHAEFVGRGARGGARMPWNLVVSVRDLEAVRRGGSAAGPRSSRPGTSPSPENACCRA